MLAKHIEYCVKLISYGTQQHDTRQHQEQVKHICRLTRNGSAWMECELVFQYWLSTHDTVCNSAAEVQQHDIKQHQ